MSLKYRDNSGNETPVAGLNGTSGELVPSVSLMQSGTVSATAGVSSYAEVTFTTPMPDTDYLVNLNMGRTVDIYAEVVGHATTGFRIKYKNNDSSAVPIEWTAFKLMTDTVHEADAAHIAQNTANFAPAFSEVTSYAVGDYVTYNNVLYRCTTAHTAGVWVAGHFTAVTVGGELFTNSSYSTSETRTGKTWIDGKPIYRKIMQMSNNVVTGQPSNVVAVVELKPCFTHLGAQIVGNITADDGYYFYVYWNSTLSEVSVHSRDTYNTGYIIIEYTKSTD